MDNRAALTTENRSPLFCEFLAVTEWQRELSGSFGSHCFPDASDVQSLIERLSHSPSLTERAHAAHKLALLSRPYQISFRSSLEALNRAAEFDCEDDRDGAANVRLAACEALYVLESLTEAREE